ncbi:hypothetical protein Tamer19_16460 [Cupriavidus sp. TA19]|uniref:YdaU family protein n=1 Tax=unclassified Cupriavidus TaxID=2640874 RepID=UPI0027294C43|nr:YdaU family protein [Cupriavidus sp. TA19]GLC92238.1 hypothetical protein Tamer19_16460 [Cupriavidus sp. TA19]
MNFYRFFIRDFDADTKGLDFTQHGAYRKLLDLFFDTELPLTRNRLGLYKLVGATRKAEREAVDSVLIQYWIETDEGWVQKRAAHELAKLQERRKVAQQNGKGGGRRSKAQTQSVMEMARMEPVPANPLGFGYGLAEWPEEKPTGLETGNPMGSHFETYLHSKPKDKTSRAHAHAREAGVDGSPGAVENRLAEKGLPDAVPRGESAGFASAAPLQAFSPTRARTDEAGDEVTGAEGMK